jgi:hypothetical protein
MDIRTIDRDELKAKIERGDRFKLVMTLNEWPTTPLTFPARST